MHPSARMLPTKTPSLTAEEMRHMSTEELNWEGAHFQHIVDLRNRERQQRIDRENARVYARLVAVRRAQLRLIHPSTILP